MGAAESGDVKLSPTPRKPGASPHPSSSVATTAHTATQSGTSSSSHHRSHGTSAAVSTGTGASGGSPSTSASPVPAAPSSGAAAAAAATAAAAAATAATVPEERKTSKSDERPKKPHHMKLEDRQDGDKVLGKYMIFRTEKDVLGAGASSTCYKGKVLDTHAPVAIKVYNEQKSGKEVKRGTLQKFRRQIEVLNEMQQPFKVPDNPRLQHEYLARVKPESVFMQVLDYSKDSNGEPGPGPDGIIYVVTELAQYSLKDFLQDRRRAKSAFSRVFIRELVKRVVLAMAALHAKGYVHLDMKPENLMVFNGVLKVIDVDGCVRIGDIVKIGDNTISFSPVYCAPEWARFILQGGNASIEVTPQLDVWSVGMLIMEFITMEPVWNPIVARLMSSAGSHKHGVFKFLEYFTSHNEPPIPKAVREKDEGLTDLLRTGLLVWKAEERKNLAELLTHPYLSEGGWEKYLSDEAVAEVVAQEAPAQRTTQRLRELPTDVTTSFTPIHKGTLWKLRKDSTPKVFGNWARRDMWIAHNHSLCYHSLRENKKMTLIGASQLSGASVESLPESAKDFAFRVICHGKEDEADTEFMLAAENEEELQRWSEMLQRTSAMEIVVTYQLGNTMKVAVEAYRCAVNNRRMSLDDSDENQNEPVFRAKLFKLKTSGHLHHEKDWYERDMWIAQNGSLVYWSPKQEGNLVYYTASDVNTATISECPAGTACRPHVFQVVLAPANGVEFEPAYFAAETEELKNAWMNALREAAHTA